MKIVSKLFVLGAALAVSTSFAYADTMGSVAISPIYGTTVSYSTSGLDYSPQGATINSQITGANGSLNVFGGDYATLDGINFLSNGNINTYTAGAEIFQASGTTGFLDYVLTSGTWAIDGHDDLTILGTGYFDVNGVDEAGSITITGSNNGIFNVETTGNTSGVTSVTPEPGSLVLLGTGLLSAAGIARKKFASKLS
jgi:hypothetical protein